MKKSIYYVATALLFVVLIIGMDGRFLGSEIKWYSVTVFVLWVAQLASDHWEDLKELFRILVK